MLEYNQLKPKTYLIYNGEPFEVIEAQISRKQQRKPVNVVKMRNLITGKVIENSFHQNEKIKEADIEAKPAQYLYERRGEVWFCQPDNPKNRSALPVSIVGDKINWLPAKTEVEILYFNNQPIGLKTPIKVEVKVTAAPPDVRGGTVQGGNKPVTIETGAIVNVPMFVKEGDTIRINTATGQYVERV